MTSRYLTVAGVTNRWLYAAFAAFAVYIAYVRLSGGHVSVAQLLFFFLLPIAAGTGLLDTARKGKFDLLFGAGVTRNLLWRHAIVRAVAIPLLLATAILAMSVPPTVAGFARLSAALLFTCGVAFTAGLSGARHAAGIVWLLLRLVFVMTPPGLNIVTRLSKGGDVAASALVAAVLAAPETLLETGIPILYAAAAAAVGAAALFTSWRWFERAELV